MADPASMAVPSTSPATEIARAFARFLPLHEEHAPHGSADEELALMADHVSDAARLAAAGDDSLVLVPLSWAAACALGLYGRLHNPAAPLRAKDAAVEALDAEVAGRLLEGADRGAAVLVASVTADLGPVLAASEDQGVIDSLWTFTVTCALAVETLVVRSGQDGSVARW